MSIISPAKNKPSKLRYEQNHPLRCFRCSVQEKEKIELMTETTEKTISEIIKEILLNEYANFENTYNQAYEEVFEEGKKLGYDEGKSDWIIKIPCHICNKNDIFLKPGEEWHKGIIKFAQQHGWGHISCYEKKKLSS